MEGKVVSQIKLSFPGLLTWPSKPCREASLACSAGANRHRPAAATVQTVNLERVGEKETVH